MPIKVSTCSGINTIIEYLEFPFDLVSPTPKPTAKPTITNRTIKAISSTLINPPLFAMCLLFLKSENFSPRGPVTSLKSVYDGSRAWNGMWKNRPIGRLNGL